MISCATRETMHRLTIRLVEAIRSDTHQAGLLVESINLVRQSRCRSEVLQVAIGDVGEVDLLGLGIDRYVVERIELSAKVVVEQN
jgi:hypothetical protein